MGRKTRYRETLRGKTMNEVLTDKELRNWRRIPDLGVALRKHFGALKPKDVDELVVEALAVFNIISGDNVQPGSPVAELFAALAETLWPKRKAAKKTTKD